MSNPEPTATPDQPTAETVVADDAKALVERAFEGLKQELHDLFHGTPAAAGPVPAQDTPPTN